MVDLGVLPGFVAAILLFLVPPGPDMAFMVAVGLGDGRRAAAHAILGIGAGMTVHAAVVVVGVGQVVQSHPGLLDAVKVLGAVYLLRLAWVTVRGARGRGAAPGPGSVVRPFRQGVVVSLTNPKVLLFFLAVLPQFLGGASSTAAQLAMLGSVNVLAEVLLYGAVGVLAGGLRSRLVDARRAGTSVSLLAGAVYATLGVVVLAEVLVASSTA
ncbi:LysE family translocator [Solicola sp. PLA-1-18]|uniref:LysE family translocator n=1 Tax=Solicola sp. PLA-1-18 TaxID=3380532 RepID=UPI003B7C80A7